MTKKKVINLPRSIHRLFPQVTSAVDSKKSIEVSVNTKDCKLSEPLNPSKCALAHAARRQFKADAVVIGINSSYIIKNNKAIRFATPESVRREIVSFDRHGDFSPGTYVLPPKAPSNRLGYRTGGNKTSAGHQDKRIIHKSARIRTLRG